MRFKEFFGIFPYLVSPVNSDGSIKEEVLTELVEHLINSGVHGLTPLGSTGEFAYLSWEQKKSIVEIVVRAAKGRVPVVAGVCHASSYEVARQAVTFEKMGVDGILAVLDTYFPLSLQQVVDYFKTIAVSVNLPIVVYNNPKFSRTDLSVDIVRELSMIDNIMYLKDASGNTGKLLTIINNFGDRIKVFSSSANIPLFVMMLGGVGWMAGPACIIPHESVRLYKLATEKKWDEAIELQKRLWKVNNAFQKYSLTACIKAGLEIQGFAVGNPIPPLKPLSLSEREEIKDILDSIITQS